MPLTLYNTMTRRREEFQPLHPPHVGMYVCGPTVYGHSHLGHAKSYVSFDVIVRYLRYLGYTVLYVQNITDVGHLSDDADEGEDKIEKQSRLDRLHPMQIAETYTRSYFEDMDALGNLRPDISPRATGHITEQIAIAERLLHAGLAYEANGSIYFDVRKFSTYGKLSGRTLEEMSAGHRIEVKSEKRHPADFALWKVADEAHIMRWPSPWGEGFPGWHLECSAMSMKYLGESFDIHGGGMENQFPHHECEIAQSEAVTGQPFVRYWLHNNMVTVDGRKMGKSLGNFIALKDAYTRWSPQIVRFFILQSHYRSTLDFSNEAVEGARKGYERLQNSIRTIRERVASPSTGRAPLGVDMAAVRTAFTGAMNDDFNTPQAISVLFNLVREVNQRLAADSSIAADDLHAVLTLYDELAGQILGLGIDVSAVRGEGESLETGLIDLLLGLRTEVRKEKLWKLSDRIRDGLAALGISLEDKREGTTWRRTNP